MVKPSNVIAIVPPNVPEAALVVTVIALLTCPAVAGSSPFGHMRIVQDGPK